MGISAGAGISAKYIALYGHENLLKAYVSVSNPYNFARLSYHLDNAFWGRFMSRLIAVTFKQNLNKQLFNPKYLSLLKEQELNSEEIKTRLEKANTCWELDQAFTYKLASNIIIRI